MNIAFWRDKKVLVTGHTGFKGGWLSLWLQDLHAQVIGFSLPPQTCPNLFTVANIEKNMRSILGDIRNLSEIQDTLISYKPEIIIHAAAQSLVRYSYNHPIDTYTTNIIGTANLLEAARQVDSVKVIINVTTDKCYDNKEWYWGYRENDNLGGNDPYSSSKACAELVTTAYRQSYFNSIGVGVATVRAGNVIGGGDWAQDRLIPDIIRNCLNNTTTTIRYPQALRPWQHVLEPLRGYLLLAQRLYENPIEYAEAWNFGPSIEDIKSVSWVVDQVITLLGNKGNWTIDRNTHPYEASILKLDIAKARTKLNWHPQWNLEKSLKETIVWYNAWHAGKDMYETTLSQIRNYINDQETIDV